MTYIFLSYAKADRATAFAVRDLLEKQGFAIWMDENVLDLLNGYWPKIYENIYNAAAFVLLVSDAAQKSSSVKRELDYAEKVQKPIFPILIQGKGWAHLQGAEIYLDFGLSLDIPELLEAQLKLLAQEKSHSLPPQIIITTEEYENQKWQSFLVKFGISALGLILCSALAFAFYKMNAHENPILPSPDQTLDIRFMTTAAPTTEVPNNLQSRQTATQQARVDAIRTQSESTLVARGYATATAHAVLTDVAQTAILRQAATNAVIEQTQVIIRETQAVAESTRASITAQAISYYPTSMSLTASAGNGVLPCSAQVRMTDNQTVLEFYSLPSLVSTRHRRTENGEWHLIVTEWIVNEEGVWYRIESNLLEGYVLADNLELAEDCPR